ncbi:hypothetical protein [Pelagibaculum spongiae]|uniref:DUF4760 domain-containing protein n=1 Tax=Pelagibaculum spongiae TaxID=2080658 RepID=A0A2V1H3E7_9GAMM|nr:hypothetical protein [Pelagibaculum spongiae]PVZ72500.1 hypothetical protein DC094_05725 [Pelagibaculum spongiae]
MEWEVWSNWMVAVFEALTNAGWSAISAISTFLAVLVALFGPAYYKRRNEKILKQRFYSELQHSICEYKHWIEDVANASANIRMLPKSTLLISETKTLIHNEASLWPLFGSDEILAMKAYEKMQKRIILLGEKLMSQINDERHEEDLYHSVGYGDEILQPLINNIHLSMRMIKLIDAIVHKRSKLELKKIDTHITGNELKSHLSSNKILHAFLIREDEITHDKIKYKNLLNDEHFQTIIRQREEEIRV